MLGEARLGKVGAVKFGEVGSGVVRYGLVR